MAALIHNPCEIHTPACGFRDVAGLLGVISEAGPTLCQGHRSQLSAIQSFENTNC